MVLNEIIKNEYSGNHSIYRVLMDFDMLKSQPHNPKVTGSSPVPATREKRLHRNVRTFFMVATENDFFGSSF